MEKNKYYIDKEWSMSSRSKFGSYVTKMGKVLGNNFTQFKD